MAILNGVKLKDPNYTKTFINFLKFLRYGTVL